MAGNNAFNNDDSMDINELAALNSDISPELIEQLQQKLSAEVQNFSTKTVDFDVNDDSTLFEEPTPKISETEDQTQNSETESEITVQPIQTNENNDDSFLKKYKAKLDKKSLPEENNTEYSTQETEESAVPQDDTNRLTNGTITEKTITQTQKEYNDSLDLLDGNVKYSKYVIYIDPQNVDFIESLTVKERKNLINNILREQDDVGMTRKKFRMVQTIIKHTIIAILTITISIPVIYWAINASLEASINNHRRAETNWGTLYKEHGKINAKQPGGN